MQKPVARPVIARFDARHVAEAVVLSHREGWPHRAEDWAMILALSDGFAALDGDRLVGTAFATAYGDGLAALNMIIVAEEARGRGIGWRLMEAAMRAAGSRAMQLVATEAGLPLYRRLGFVDAGGIAQHQGEAAAVPMPKGLETAAPADLDAVAALDAQAFGGDRRGLWEKLFAAGEVLAVRGSGHRLIGMACCRDFGRGRVIGPVVAPDAATAWRLVSGQVARNRGAFLRIDVPEDSGLARRLESAGLTRVDGGRLMRRGSRPATGPARILALASQALG